MAVLIGGRQFWLWRAVDDEGEVLDLLVQRPRDARAAAKLMRKLLRKQGFAPKTLVTDKLRPMERPGCNWAWRLAMSKAYARTIGPRIGICRFGDANGRCSVSNLPDQRNGSCLFTPSSRIRSTFSALLFPATRSASSGAKRCRIGRQRSRPEFEPSPSDFRVAKAKFS
jgi:DDE domain